jgi:hypothetical protein
VRWAAMIGICVIFLILGLVIYASNFHHIWPSSDTVNIKL